MYDNNFGHVAPEMENIISYLSGVEVKTTSVIKLIHYFEKQLFNENSMRW